MTRPSLLIHGELYLTLETVAECYSVEISWLQQVYELDMVGPGERVDGSLAIAALMLDRVAEIRRVYLQTGMELSGIAVMLRFNDPHETSDQ